MTTNTEIERNFEQLFRRHYQQLCSYANSFLNDMESSEDVVQELFIKIWDQQKLQMGVENLKFYLFTAVRNNCLSRIRKNKKNYFEELRDEDAADEMLPGFGKVDEAPDTNALIANALNRLPPKCREVFLLSRLSGQTYLQIARSLGISVKTVENQMGKAIRLLKVFAKENNIYAAMACFVWGGKIFFEIIGVYAKNGF